jgi:hypothetical protein
LTICAAHVRLLRGTFFDAHTSHPGQLSDV